MLFLGSRILHPWCLPAVSKPPWQAQKFTGIALGRVRQLAWVGGPHHGHPLPSSVSPDRAGMSHLGSPTQMGFPSPPPFISLDTFNILTSVVNTKWQGRNRVMVMPVPNPHFLWLPLNFCRDWSLAVPSLIPVSLSSTTVTSLSDRT